MVLHIDNIYKVHFNVVLVSNPTSGKIAESFKGKSDSKFVLSFLELPLIITEFFYASRITAR